MVTVSRLTGLAGLALAGSVLISAQPITYASTFAPGASTFALRAAADGSADKQSPAVATPTFTKDVLPILQRSCQSCHRPGTPAPMSLLTYAEARPWARAIKTKVTSREMPPWHIDRS